MLAGSMKTLLLGVAILGCNAQRFEDNCVNHDKKTCVLATSGAYAQETACSGWCDESRQCLGREARMCPLEEMAWEDYGFVSSIHWNAPQCTAITTWGASGLGVSISMEGWCLPNSANGDFTLGHCTENPVKCDVSTSTLYTKLTDIPCRYRGTSCFDCVAVSDVAEVSGCAWCPSTQTCTDVDATACDVTAFVEPILCPNENRHRAKFLQAARKGQ
eukprot:Gregarina_sp_Pseudo_9__4539@NODE_470_length_2761_cov_548_494122_g446_i0_p3_GENE_NODE_470_length_2761_cov_548_494122_g446_i0NODE_470_length_2761_cov_548_494122_g446_i0_p3_ORF_typecomplete_len217_score33_73PSI/PF01437_25/4_1e03PSI/PF01437_25/1_1e03PSI/PF01437_25/0_00038TSCPD/PF12637_7/0_016AgrD/PF05931_11/0_31AgrD/PF05931_11/8_6e03_NODE_470_length_2761_cov_548_494122_g446_i010711721